MGSDPRGAINGALYGLIDSPYQIGGDLLAGTVCGNGSRLGRGIGNGGMAYLSTIHGAQRMLDTILDRPPPTRARLPDEEPSSRRPVEMPCGLNSFSADTLVATEDGLQPISTISIGDRVLAYDEATHSTGFFTVTAVISHTDPATLQLKINDTVLETTSEHPFYTWEHGWVNAGQLHVGQHIHQANGSYGIVRSVTIIQHPQPMYNLTVAQAHTFFVGQGRWLVHNSTPCWPPDLSSVDSKLQKIAEKYKNDWVPPGGQIKRLCHLCADEMTTIIKGLGYDADILRVRSPSPRGWIVTLDNRVVATNGWHDLVRIKNGGQELFIDSEIYLKRGPHPITWNELDQFYQDADIFSKERNRNPGER